MSKKSRSFVQPEVEHCDVWEFFVPNRDSSGESLRIVVSFHPEHDRLMDRVLRDGRFPYRNQQAIIRHAVYRHLIWLSEQEEFPGYMPTELRELLVSSIRSLDIRDGFENSRDALFDILIWCLRAGELQLARRLYMKFRTRLLELDNEFRREECEQILDKQWASLLRRPGVLLRPEVFFFDPEAECDGQ